MEDCYNDFVVIGDRKVKTKYSVKKIIKFENFSYVLLKIPRVDLEYDELNNVFCYDAQGNLVWQIDNSMPSCVKSKEQIPYIDLEIIDGLLYATDFWGRRFLVERTTGKLLDIKIVH